MTDYSGAFWHKVFNGDYDQTTQREGAGMNNVVSLTGGLTGQREVSPLLVQTLKDLLEKAEAGEIVAAAFATTHHDGTTSWDVAGLIGGHSIIGAIEMAKAYIVDCNARG